MFVVSVNLFIGLVTFSYISSLCHCNYLNESIYIESQQHEIANNFSEAIADIVRTYFVGRQSRVAYNFQVKAKCFRNMNFFYSIVEKTMKLLKEDIATILRSDAYIPDSNDMHFSILLVDSYEAVKFLYTNIIKYHLYHYGSFFIVFHSLCPHWYYYNEMTDILTLSWSSGVSHIDVMVYAMRNVILSFHGIPFSKFHCHRNLPEIHNKFRDGHWYHKKFFVSKVGNIHGCPLVCSTWEDLPYFKISPRSTPEKPAFLGLEGRLLEYLLQRMNFKLTFRWMSKTQINRTIYDQGGLLRELFSSGTHFTVGSFHYKTTKRDDPYTPTISYYPSTYYFVVSSKTEPYQPFEKLLLPFNLDVWAVLICLCVGGNIIIYFFSHKSRLWQLLILGRRNKSPYYNLLVVLLGGPALQDPKISFSRFLLMVWLFNMTIVRTVYQSLMFHVLKHDLHKQPPMTIQELTSGYKVLMSETVYSRIKNFTWLLDSAQVLNTSELRSFEMLKDPSLYAPKKIAILTAFEYLGFYLYSTKSGIGNFHLVPQPLFTQQLSIYMRKNSVLLNRINVHIEKFINEGLMNRWERVLIHNERFYRRYGDEEAKALKLRELYGALNLLAIGLGVCMFVFVVEFIVEFFITYRTKEWRSRHVGPFEYIE